MRRQVDLVRDIDALLRGPDPSSLSVGLAIPLTGHLALTGPSILEATILGAHEANEIRGASERPLRLVLVDSAGPAPAAGRSIADLAEAGVVDAFVGAHTSSTLVTVEQTMGQQVTPYVFAPGYEGARRRPGFYCAGETPSDAADHVRRVVELRDVHEWALLGTDYVWPRAMRESMGSALREMGTVVYEASVPMGQAGRRIGPLLDELVASGARGIVVNMAGMDLVDTLRAIRRKGLDASTVRFAAGLEENVLLAVGGDGSGNLYSTLHSFAAQRTPERQALELSYEALVGASAPVLTSWAVRAHDGILLLADLEQRGMLTSDALHTDPTGARAGVAQPSYRPHLVVAAGLRLEEGN